MYISKSFFLHSLARTLNVLICYYSAFFEAFALFYYPFIYGSFYSRIIIYVRIMRTYSDFNQSS